MIKETIKGYTVFNGLYQNKDKKMFSRTEKKEVIGNRLHKNFFKENFELLTLHLWDVQLDIKDYDNPQNNKNVTELIKQMRHTVKLLTNEKNEYGQYLREQTQQFLEWWDNYVKQSVKDLPPQQNIEQKPIKHTAKHYVLTYLMECHAKGESFPRGQKKELERIGNERMGKGKGNTFYKVFNKIVHKDVNAEKDLIEIGGENWRKIIKELSNDPETIEIYLKTKQL